jgi:hypothetical protein
VARQVAPKNSAAPLGRTWQKKVYGEDTLPLLGPALHVAGKPGPMATQPACWGAPAPVLLLHEALTSKVLAPRVAPMVPSASRLLQVLPAVVGLQRRRTTPAARGTGRSRWRRRTRWGR